MKKKRKWLLLAGVLALVAVLAGAGLNRKTDIQNFTAQVERGDIHDVVDATGTINAVITVQVGSQVSGTIAKLNADFNSRVHKGDVVAVIDPALFKGALLQADADLQNAKANLVAARANLEKAKAARLQTKSDYDRNLGLFQNGITSQQQLDLAKAAFDSANASVGAADANVTQAAAQVAQKDAAVNIAKTNLNYTVIRSPIDGTVVARNVDVGQTVAASLQAPTIFTIAQDLTKMLVYAKTDESDVGSIKIGKPVTFKVDAFPKDTFQGEVTQVRMNATTIQNVVTYDTIISFANPELKLFPGMTAYVTIPVATARDVLKLPNTALRYRPPMSAEEVLAIYKQHGLQPTGARPVGAQFQSTAASEPADGDIQNLPHRPKSDTAIVWKLLPGKAMTPVQVSLGITDHSYTEVKGVLNGQLKDGDELIIRSVTPKSDAPGGMPR